MLLQALTANHAAVENLEQLLLFDQPSALKLNPCACPCLCCCGQLNPTLPLLLLLLSGTWTSCSSLACTLHC
jgi:hypothetical protein